MRAVTAAEVEWIVGGLAKKMPVRTKSLFKKPSGHIGTEVEPPVTVTGTPITSGYGDTWGPGAPGGTGTGGGGSSAGGGGGGGSSGAEQETENALKSLAEELQSLARGGDPTILDWIEMTEDVAGIGAGEFADNVAAGEWEWNAYKETGDPSDSLPGGENWPINWEKFNWAKIPGASSAPSFEAALQDAINWAHAQE